VGRKSPSSHSSLQRGQFIASIDFVMQRWAETIKRVSLLAKDTVPPLGLPKNTVDNPIRLSFLEDVDINSWCVDAKVLSHFVVGRSKDIQIQHLQLPKILSSPGLPLSGLRSIVEASPDLVYSVAVTSSISAIFISIDSFLFCSA